MGVEKLWRRAVRRRREEGPPPPASLYHFSPDTRRVWIDTPEPPHPFRNILFNRSYYTIIDQMARGTGRHMTRRDGWINNVIRNERLLYVRDDETGVFFSAVFAPCYVPFERFRCTAGLNWQQFEIDAARLSVRWRIYVPEGEDPVEVWDVRIADRSGLPRRASLFACVEMWCDGVDLYAGELCRIARYEEALHAVIVRMDAERHTTIDFPWHNGFLAAAPAPAGWDCNPGVFVGPRRTFERPLAVERGQCGRSSMAMWPPIAALHVRLDVPAGGHADARLLVGACADAPMMRTLTERYLPWSADRDPHFDALEAAQTRLTALPALRTPEPTIDRMLAAWVKKQIHYGAYWGRWGWKGYRDTVQQAMGGVAFDPALAREELLGACAHQYADGFALRGWRPVDTKRYADSAQWLIHAATEYLKETGDMAFLDESAPFFDGGQAPVREHLRRAFERLDEDRGPHGLCLAHGGDWNDSLTGVCRRGRGESVWLSMAYCRCALLLAELARFEGRAADAARYETCHEAMARAINQHAWDGQWYLCALDDDGNPIGSATNDEGKIFLNMQSWAQLGRVADDARWEAAWTAVRRHLDTGWGLMLQWPVYTRPRPNIGRLSYIRPGAAENGMVYTHGNAWMILALLERGLADEALRLWRQIAPGGERHPPCQPNVFFNGYYGPDSEIQPGLADHAWMTGSAAWMFMIVFESMLGLRRHYDGLRVRPCLPSAWAEAAAERRFRGTLYRVRILNPARREAAPLARLDVDGQPAPLDAPLPLDGGEHEVVATLAT